LLHSILQPRIGPILVARGCHLAILLFVLKSSTGDL
jgi:hypothetical protein